MAEESKQKFDPDATVAQPGAGANPGADPDATVLLPAAELDPEATFTGPAAKKSSDVEASDRRPVFDPDATVNPAERLKPRPCAGSW